MKRRARTAALVALASSLCLPAACADDADTDERARIDFVASEPIIEPIVLDSGMVQVTDGVQMRTVTTMRITWELEASGRARGQRIFPIADTGALAARGEIEVEVYAKVDLPDYQLDGFVGADIVQLETDLVTFDPFLIEEPKILGFDIPAEYEIRLDPASGTGLAFVVTMSLGMFPTFEGTCIAVDFDEDAAQYTGRVQPLGDMRYTYGVDVVTPLGRSRLGDVGLELDFEQIGQEVNFGSYSLEDGTAVDGATPCG